MIYAAQSQEYKSLAPLEDLYTELDITLTANLISWFPHARLRRLRLTVSSGHRNGFQEISQLENEINRLLEAHRHTLEEIIFADMCNSDLFISRFNARWQNHFVTTDLVLHFFETWSRDGANMLADNIDHFMTTDDRWGSKLQRVRLEGPRLGKKQEDFLNGAPITNLRILILCPRWISQTEHFPHDVASFPEGRLAQRLAYKGPPSLRYVAIGLDRFWIDKETDQAGLKHYTVMHFRHAHSGGYSDDSQDELRVRMEIRDWMNEEDMAFIDEDSKLNKDRVLDPGGSVFAFTQRWNFAIARRVRGMP